MKNYYEILEVNPKASTDIIKKVYKIKIKKNHPDLFQGEEKIKAEEITKQLTEAYNILCDENKRKEYDETLKTNDTSIEQYKKIISSLKEENDYLKNMLLSKDNTINSFMKNNNTQKDYVNKYEQNIYEGNNDINNMNNINQDDRKSYSKNYFFSMLYDLKQFAFKLALFFLSILALLLTFSLITKTNVFKLFF